MAILPQSSRTQTFNAPSAVAGPFDISLRLFDDSVNVWVNGLPRTDFTLSATFANGFTDDATITFNTALLAGDAVIIDALTDVEREYDYAPTEKDLTAKINIELGRIWSTIADLNRDVLRAPKILGVTGRALSLDPGDLVSISDDGLGFSGLTIAEINAPIANSLDAAVSAAAQSEANAATSAAAAAASAGPELQGRSQAALQFWATQPNGTQFILDGLPYVVQAGGTAGLDEGVSGISHAGDTAYASQYGTGYQAFWACGAVNLVVDKSFSYAGTLTTTTPPSSIRFTGTSQIAQTQNNTTLLQVSGNGSEKMTVDGLNIVGVGAADTASCVNADFNDAVAQAFGMKVENLATVIYRNARTKGFKNAGVFSNFIGELCHHVGGRYEGTHEGYGVIDAAIPLSGSEIGDGNAATQQFGIVTGSHTGDGGRENWRSQAAANDAPETDASAAHGGGLIHVENCGFGNTSIGTYNSPGYDRVVVENVYQLKDLPLSQHVVYMQCGNSGTIARSITGSPNGTVCKAAYPALSRAHPALGVVIDGVTGLTRAGSPLVTLEGNDKAAPAFPFANGPARYGAVNPIITNIHGLAGQERLLSIRNAAGYHASNITCTGYSTSTRMMIETLYSYGTIENATLCNADTGVISTKVALGGQQVFRNILCHNTCQTVSTGVLNVTEANAATPAESAYPLQVDTYYVADSGFLVQDGNFIYRCVQTGITGNPLALTFNTGTQQTESGTAGFDLIGDINTLLGKDVGDIVFDNVEFSESGVASNEIFLNDRNMRVSVLNVRGTFDKDSTIKGLAHRWGANSLGNTPGPFLTAPGNGLAIVFGETVWDGLLVTDRDPMTSTAPALANRKGWTAGTTLKHWRPAANQPQLYHCETSGTGGTGGTAVFAGRNII